MSQKFFGNNLDDLSSAFERLRRAIAAVQRRDSGGYIDPGPVPHEGVQFQRTDGSTEGVFTGGEDVILIQDSEGNRHMAIAGEKLDGTPPLDGDVAVARAVFLWDTDEAYDDLSSPYRTSRMSSMEPGEPPIDGDHYWGDGTKLQRNLFDFVALWSRVVAFNDSSATEELTELADAWQEFQRAFLKIKRWRDH